MPTTKPMGERIMAVETKLTNVCDDITELKTSNTTEHQEIKSLIEKGMNGKANKWVETFVYAIISGGFLYIMYQILELLIHRG